MTLYCITARNRLTGEREAKEKEKFQKFINKK